MEKEMEKEKNNQYGKLIFEGEYLNGERKKGKEYNKYGKSIFEGGDLLFEGEYLNGERWNEEGKEYDDDDELIFEGEYLNGKKMNKIYIISKKKSKISYINIYYLSMIKI